MTWEKNKKICLECPASLLCLVDPDGAKETSWATDRAKGMASYLRWCPRCKKNYFVVLNIQNQYGEQNELPVHAQCPVMLDFQVKESHSVQCWNCSRGALAWH